MILHHITNYTTYELKTGKFKAEYKGQMELYINWLKKYDTNCNN
ncbi:hypothetical protein [Candidatus Tisiphia endosymbiont of Metellina segmentata]